MFDGLAWSYGVDKYDALPTQHAGSLREFTLFVRAHRACDKQQSGYIAGPISGHRLAKNAQPRNWLALDVDRIDAAVHVSWRLFAAAKFLGLGWPTASSRADAPRERLVVMLDEELSPKEALSVGRLLISDVSMTFGDSIYIDESTLRAAQPAFLPLVSARGFYLLADPLDADALRARIPKRSRPTATQRDAQVPDVALPTWAWVVESFRCRGAIVSEIAGKGFAIECPWRTEHSPGPSSISATALLCPSEENGHRGAFRCLHSHCAQRGLKSVVNFLQAQVLAT